MGQEIVYCFRCATRLVSSDFEKGRAARMGNRDPELPALRGGAQGGVRTASGRGGHGFTLRGENMAATMDGLPVSLVTDGKPLRGHLQFNASDGTARIHSVDFRDLK